MQASETSTESKQTQPNILFIAFDDLRPLIGAYNEPEPITPNLDAFAQDAVRFDRAYVNYPLCNPSRAAMLTGVRFDLQGDWKNNKHQNLIKAQTTWPRVLRDNGYWTATRGKLYHGKVPGSEKKSWDIAGKFWQGKYKDGGPNIESKIVDIGGRQDQIKIYKDKGAGPGSLMYASVDGPDDLLIDGQTASSVIDLIVNKRDKSKPFMISAGFSRPHMPWVAPKKYFDMYPQDAGKLAPYPIGAPEAFDNAKYKSKTRDFGWNEGVDDNTAQQLIRGYMASTSYADAQMGKIIQTLKDEDLYDNTIIIVWGDHGYHLTDHGLWRKNTPFHIALRSPLMIKTQNSKAGIVVDTLVQNIDLYPTIMELTNSTPNKTINLHGRSLVPLLQGEHVAWDNVVYTAAKGTHGLVTEKYRFTKVDSGKHELYDLLQDPNEWHNLAGDPAHKEMIQNFLQKLSKVNWNRP
ncbi:sulfatase [Thalassotalea sp. HSM 43]|uniref:sulfatase n=1 Tax=Thalassotalea sp. HSM 43 TaxID=2552945 RepID=UPI001679958B|nr:sulfatase [Thalassotalea sp. HSM 43]